MIITEGFNPTRALCTEIYEPRGRRRKKKKKKRKEYHADGERERDSLGQKEKPKEEQARRENGEEGCTGGKRGGETSRDGEQKTMI